MLQIQARDCKEGNGESHDEHYAHASMACVLTLFLDLCLAKSHVSSLKKM
jgi:hypothetical protein